MIIFGSTVSREGLFNLPQFVLYAVCKLRLGRYSRIICLRLRSRTSLILLLLGSFRFSSSPEIGSGARTNSR